MQFPRKTIMKVVLNVPSNPQYSAITLPLEFDR